MADTPTSKLSMGLGTPPDLPKKSLDEEPEAEVDNGEGNYTVGWMKLSSDEEGVLITHAQAKELFTKHDYAELEEPPEGYDSTMQTGTRRWSNKSRIKSMPLISETSDPSLDHTPVRPASANIKEPSAHWRPNLASHSQRSGTVAPRESGASSGSESWMSGQTWHQN